MADELDVPPPPYQPKRGNALASLYRSVGRFLPSFMLEDIRQMLKKAGDEETVPEEWLGGAFVVVFFYSLLFTVLPFLFFGLTEPQHIISAALLFSLMFFLYYYVMYRAMMKAHETDFRKTQFVFLKKRFFVRLYHSISKFYPWNFREHVRRLLIFSGDRWSTPEEWLGIASLCSFLYAIIGGLIAYGFLSLPIYLPPFAFLFTLIVGMFLSYMRLYYKAENRKKAVEEVLPDFLQLIAANIRAGMTPFAALRASARKDFGPLEYEVEYATARSLGTESFPDALKEVSRTIKSDVLERVIGLFASGLKSGGTLSALLENAAQDISQTQELNKQLVSSTKMYTMFILFNIAIGSPLMLSISMEFVGMMQGFQDSSSGGDNLMEQFGLGSGEIALTTDFLFKTSLLIITVTCFIASAFMGVINDGSIKNGFRYFLPLAIFSILVFLFFRIFVSQIISSMI